jgi:hypothetical protein
MIHFSKPHSLNIRMAIADVKVSRISNPEGGSVVQVQVDMIMPLRVSLQGKPVVSSVLSTVHKRLQHPKDISVRSISLHDCRVSEENTSNSLCKGHDGGTGPRDVFT